MDLIRVMPAEAKCEQSTQRSYDAVIVGGGVIGLSCAWRAARRGARVAVVERSAPPAGATRVAAGMLAPVGELAFGEPELLKMTLAAAELYPDFVAELEAASGVSTGYRARRRPARRARPRRGGGAAPGARAAALARARRRVAAAAPLPRAGARPDAVLQRRRPRARARPRSTRGRWPRRCWRRSRPRTGRSC